MSWREETRYNNMWKHRGNRWVRIEILHVSKLILKLSYTVLDTHVHVHVTYTFTCNLTFNEYYSIGNQMKFYWKRGSNYLMNQKNSSLNTSYKTQANVFQKDCCKILNALIFIVCDIDSIDSDDDGIHNDIHLVVLKISKSTTPAPKMQL